MKAAPPPTIPLAALEDHIAILGKTGAGKSNAAKTVVEDLLDRGERLCIIDPTGTWFGLRLTPARKPSPYPLVIFGGQHADVAIAGSHGTAIAAAVATSKSSCIIDTRLLTVDARTRFFTDFAEELLRTNQGPLHLVIDEAHLFAPKGKVNSPQAGMMLSATNNLVSLGRGIGLRIMMLSQRPAKLHNDSLGQVETMVAMRMTLPHDRAAVQDWIKEQADERQGREIMASLPGLPTGDAWVWWPQDGLLERRHFPLARTFDSGRAQKSGADAPALAPLDLAAITEKLTEVAAEVLANDPKTLKAQVASLKRQLEQRPAADPELIQRALERGRREVSDSFKADIERARSDAFTEGQLVMITRVQEDFSKMLEKIGPLKALPTPTANSPIRQPAPEKSAAPALVKQVQPAIASDDGAKLNMPTDLVLTPALQKILDALLWRENLQRQPGAATGKIVLAFLVGMSAGGGGFNNYLGKLRSSGYIAYQPGGTIALTDDGRRRASAPEFITNQDVQEAALAKLQAQLQKIMRFLISAYPEAVTKLELAEYLEMSPTGGGFSNYIGKLRTLLLLDYPQQGQVRATDFLFPEGS